MFYDNNLLLMKTFHRGIIYDIIYKTKLYKVGGSYDKNKKAIFR